MATIDIEKGHTLMRKPARNRSCPNPSCALRGRFDESNIVLHSFISLKRGRRRRYRCKACGKTFCSTTRTPYYRLKYPRSTFDTVATMSVEGVSKSAIARIKRLSWNTVARWLARAAAAARRFNNWMTHGYELKELQADEIRTFTARKTQPTWVLVATEVWSRLWSSTVIGRRSYASVKSLLRDTIRRGEFVGVPLITTDGFYVYRTVLGRLLGRACVHGQVVKSWRKGRVTTIERELVIGSRGQLEAALRTSEDSCSLNTAFIERLNLTIRQGSAYLHRRTPCHARIMDYLDDHLELLRSYYNFVRPHRALKFGRETRAPAMQAGLVSKRLSLRDIFMAMAAFSAPTVNIVEVGTRLNRHRPLQSAA